VNFFIFALSAFSFCLINTPKMFNLKDIFNHFRTKGDFIRAKELGSGHINDTFLIETVRPPFYVLQRINHRVFKKPAQVIENKVAISQHLQSKLSHLPETELQNKVLIFVPTKSGKTYYRDAANNFWNLMIYIDDCVSFERVPNKKIAFEAGRIYAEFLSLTRDFDTEKLFKVLPDFHTMSVRLKQFDESRKNSLPKRNTGAKDLISFVREQRDEMLTIEKLINEHKIPLRLTHSDTKISNALFSQNEKALCVIDTDTVMPGAVHFDFGDAVRTICNTAFEDEKDLSKVKFNFDFYKSFAKGFLNSPLKNELSPTEIRYLAFSARMMTFIMGLRMLTDFLNNDIYYKTKYENHNLDRAKNQFKLLSEMDRNFVEMKEVIKTEFFKF
jgi:hypothetical protein